MNKLNHPSPQRLLDMTINFDGRVIELFNDQGATNALSAGEKGIVVLDNTPFYAESGGQVGDKGQLQFDGGTFVVEDTVKLGEAIAHHGVAQGTLSVGTDVAAQICQANRNAIRKNHSATHLLHSALKNILGEHVNQKGSLVDAERLRFDFSHFEGVTEAQLREIENSVNSEIQNNHHLNTQLMDLEAAKASGAMALFGEKYDEKVRVVAMGEFSIELCGGTHVDRTGDIGLFRIQSEAGIASGIRRIEAVTGMVAIDAMQQQQRQLQSVAGILKSDSANVVDRTSQLLEQSKGYEKEIAGLKQQLAAQAGSDLMNQVSEVGGVKLLVAKLDGVEAKALRGLMDDLKNQLGSGLIVLGIAGEGKVNLIAGVTKDLVGSFKAGELLISWLSRSVVRAAVVLIWPKLVVHNQRILKKL